MLETPAPPSKPKLGVDTVWCTLHLGKELINLPTVSITIRRDHPPDNGRSVYRTNSDGPEHPLCWSSHDSVHGMD